MDSYLKKIDAFVAQMSLESQKALDQITHRKTFSKGEYLLKQDEVCRHSFFIESGVARKYYLTPDGKEINTELLFENDIAVSFQSYILQKPSMEFIQALDDVTATVTDYKEFDQLKNSHSELARLDLMITEYYAMWLEQRLTEFHTLDAAARYNKLIKEHPYIIKNVRLTHIASYLGVSLETLSRIRARK